MIGMRGPSFIICPRSIGLPRGFGGAPSPIVALGLRLRSLRGQAVAIEVRDRRGGLSRLFQCRPDRKPFKAGQYITFRMGAAASHGVNLIGIGIARKSVVSGKSVSVSVDLGGRRIVKKKTQ